MIHGTMHIAVADIAALGAVLLIFGLQSGEAVLFQLQLRLLRVDAIEAGIVAAEDGRLHRTVSRAERGEAKFLLHVLRDLQAPEALDLPLRRAGPQRISAPVDVID